MSSPRAARSARSWPDDDGAIAAARRRRRLAHARAGAAHAASRWPGRSTTPRSSSGATEYLGLPRARGVRWRARRGSSVPRSAGAAGGPTSSGAIFAALDRADPGRADGPARRPARRSTISFRRRRTRVLTAWTSTSRSATWRRRPQYRHFICSSSGSSCGRPRCSRPTRSSAIAGRSTRWSPSGSSCRRTWRSRRSTSCRYLVAVQHRGALPAHPLARLRRAVRVAAPADRRPGVDLVGLPARRNASSSPWPWWRRSCSRMTAASAPLAGACGAASSSSSSACRGRSSGSCRPAARPGRSAWRSARTPSVGQHGRPNGALALRIQRSPPDEGRYYWRAVAYDKFELKGWSQTTVHERTVAPGGDARLRPARRRRHRPGPRTASSSRSRPVGLRRASTILAPADADPDRPGRPTCTTIGEDGYFAMMDRTDGRRRPYTVTAMTLVPGNDPRPAQRSCAPGDIDYLSGRGQGPVSRTAPVRRARARSISSSRPKILARGAVPTPLRPRRATRRRSPLGHVRYATDVRDRGLLRPFRPSSASRRFKRGFCQYYAATMAVILRDLGVPTRIVEGFLPGAREDRHGRGSHSATHMRGSRSTSRGSAGSRSTRPAADCRQLAPLPSGTVPWPRRRGRSRSRQLGTFQPAP